MFRRADVDPAGSTAAGRPGSRTQPVRRSPAGSALDALLDCGPGFATALRGYDRLEVDNYVAWAEGELLARRRQTEDLLTRYGRCSAELELSRRLLARSPEGQDLTAVSERIGTMLRLAADEAAARTAAGAAEAEALLAEARVDADARLRKAQEIKQLAVAAADRLREDAERMRAEAAEELARARVHAATAEEVAALRAELEDLRRQRDSARESLRHLTTQLDEALDALAAPQQGPVELVVVGNVARG